METMNPYFTQRSISVVFRSILRSNSLGSFGGGEGDPVDQGKAAPMSSDDPPRLKSGR